MSDRLELSAASSRGCPPRQVDDDGGRPGAQARTANEPTTTRDGGPTARPRPALGSLDVLIALQIRASVSEIEIRPRWLSYRFPLSCHEEQMKTQCKREEKAPL